ncbi:hypothetical protein [Ekhidna sp.]
MTTPLIEAVRINHLPITKLLIENGADPRLVSSIGESAFKLAKLQNNERLIALFKRKKRSLFSLHQIFKKIN